MKGQRFGVTLCLSLALVILTSCHTPAPHLPPDWLAQRVSSGRFIDGDEARVHVFIIYADRMVSHVALRVYSPERGAVFWDPAGGYGDPRYPVVARRVRDIVVDPVPSVKDYLEFRQYLPTPKMEVFEFPAAPEDANHMIDMLRASVEKKPGAYRTRTRPFFCGASISAFLETHGSGVMEVSRAFFPHDFAKALYDQDGVRVFLHSEGGLKFVYPATVE